jgi:hypothetical protein
MLSFIKISTRNIYAGPSVAKYTAALTYGGLLTADGRAGGGRAEAKNTESGSRPAPAPMLRRVGSHASSSNMLYGDSVWSYAAEQLDIIRARTHCFFESAEDWSRCVLFSCTNGQPATMHVCITFPFLLLTSFFACVCKGILLYRMRWPPSLQHERVLVQAASPSWSAGLRRYQSHQCQRTPLLAHTLKYQQVKVLLRVQWDFKDLLMGISGIAAKLRQPPNPLRQHRTWLYTHHQAHNQSMANGGL